MSEIDQAVELLRQQINCRNKNKILLQASTIAQLKQSSHWDAVYDEFIRRELLSLGYTDMLMVIANNVPLISMSYCEYLPNSYKILHELAYLSEAEIVEGIHNKIIEKTMSLTTAKKLRSQSSN